jgi:putative ABC transport system ATP-binding protein
MNLRLKDVTRSWRLPDGSERTVFRLSKLDVPFGTHLGIFGPSGSGKSTFLNLISGMLPVSSGSIFFGDYALHKMSESARDAFRAKHIGYIFQNFHLFQGYTALENVQMGMLFSGGKTSRSKAQEILARVGLADRLHDTPGRLSTGQRQRVAIARALAHDPEIILADEPTGNLDPKNAGEVMDLLFEVAANRTLLVVTHDQNILRRFKNTITLGQQAEAV